MSNRNRLRTEEPRRRYYLSVMRFPSKDQTGRRQLNEEGELQDMEPEPVPGLEFVRCAYRIVTGDYAASGTTQVMPHATHIFRCRWHNQISVGHQIRFQGKMLQIVRVVPVQHPIEGRLSELDIYCTGQPQ